MRMPSMIMEMKLLMCNSGWVDGMFHDNAGFCWAYATHYDNKTNLPLTKDVLNEAI